jgi:DNA-binding Xre family transcriptional regulator
VTWDGAAAHAAAENYAGWASLLEEHPKVLWGLIADVVKAIKAGEGEKRTGRRPAASVGSLDELYEILFPPAFSMSPFTETFSRLLGDISQTEFAARTGINQGTVSRLLSGRHTPTVETMERIAYTLGVKPTIFAEYRAQKIGQVVQDVLMAKPGMSADCVRDLIGARG